MADFAFSDLPDQGGTNNASDVNTPFGEIKTYLNSADWVDDARIVSPNNSAYRTILNAQQLLVNDYPSTSTTPVFLTSAVTSTFGSAADSTSNTAVISAAANPTISSGQWLAATSPFMLYVAAADHAVDGKTAKLRIRAQALCNATAPGRTFTIGLYPVTVAGAADTLTITAGTLVTSSTATLTTPALSTVTSAAGSDISLPSDGMYALAWLNDGAIANNSAVLLTAQLQLRWV